MDISKIVDVSVTDIDYKDYPDFCDAYIDEAYYENDDGSFVKLTDEELDELNDDRDFVYEKILEKIC